jgi:D-alanyl-D-alanine carboxypeptidase
VVTPRSVTAIAVLVSLVALAPKASAAGDTDRDDIGSLRRAADKARAELEGATKKWERRKRDLVQSRQKLQSTLQDLGAADVRLNRIRSPLAGLANAAYQGPGAAGSMVIFGDGSADEALRSAADTSHLADNQNTLVREAATLRQQHDWLTASAQDLESRNAVEQAGLQRQIDSIKHRSAQLTQQLTAALDRIGADRDQRFEIGCSVDLVADARKFPNGLIPARYLCKLPQGALLRADAARTFFKLNTAYKKRFGRDMCITSSYRGLAEQQSIYASRPGFAAVPGRSNHGLGTALDLCGGVQNQGSLQFNWLRANSQAYGWFHPSWAYSSPFEPWHWEYKTSKYT